MVEGFYKVGLVEMGVYVEYLGEDGFVDSWEFFGKFIMFFNVFIKFVGGDGWRCELLVLREWDISRVGGEDFFVVDFVRDLVLYKCYVFVGR